MAATIAYLAKPLGAQSTRTWKSSASWIASSLTCAGCLTTLIHVLIPMELRQTWVEDQCPHLQTAAWRFLAMWLVDVFALGKMLLTIFMMNGVATPWPVW